MKQSVPRGATPRSDKLAAWLEAIWYGGEPVPWWLLGMSWLFGAVAGARRWAYGVGLLRRRRIGCPVIVVGNIATGGTGKTPLVVWLCEYLRGLGHRPGIVCRGYRGAARVWPCAVTADSDPALVGDEAVLLARRTGAPVSAGPDRVAAAQALVSGSDCTLVISDDGLQHLRLARDIEIAVIDAGRRHGNGRLLPAGPLREPVSRLLTVDLTVLRDARPPASAAMDVDPAGVGLGKGGAGSVDADGHRMTLDGDAACALGSPARRPLADFAPGPVHAVCGIGNPRAFFASLRIRGVEVIEHAFSDHHPFAAGDLAFCRALPILMTEKDAVKCRAMGLEDAWYVPVTARLPPALEADLDRLLDGLPARGATLPSVAAGRAAAKGSNNDEENRW